MIHRFPTLFGFVLVAAVIGCDGDVSRTGGRSGASREVAVEAPTPPAVEHEECDGCARARASHAVCRRCRTPYLCGLDVRSTELHDLVDVPGHRFDAERLECATCREAVSEEGWCEVHGVGFRRGMVHASRLGHAIAFGTSAPDALHADCPTCAGSELDPKWCQRCGHGRVGNLRYVERHRFDLVENEFLRLKRAIAEFGRCERCPLAHFSGTTCPKCRTRHPKVEPPNGRR